MTILITTALTIITTMIITMTTTMTIIKAITLDTTKVIIQVLEEADTNQDSEVEPIEDEVLDLTEDLHQASEEEPEEATSAVQM